MTTRPALEAAHKHSIRHRQEIEASAICGCFGCLAIFPPAEILDWTDYPDDAPEGDENELGVTALCPKCGIDSVIGSASGFPITREFLDAMEVRWFNSRRRFGRA